MSEIKVNYVKPEMDVYFLSAEVVRTSDGTYDEKDDKNYVEIQF